MVYEFSHMAVSDYAWRKSLAVDLMQLPMDIVGPYVVGLDNIPDVWLSLPENEASGLADQSSVHLFRETAKRAESHIISPKLAIATMMLIARLNRPISLDDFVSHLLYIDELLEESPVGFPSNYADDEAASLCARISSALPEVASCTLSDFSFLLGE